jgi:hypothetical protein
MIFSMPSDPELSRRPTVPGSSASRRSPRRWARRRSSPASSASNSQPSSPQALSRDTTWQTLTNLSGISLELPLLDFDLQEWYTAILEYIDRDDSEIAASSEDDEGRQSREMSWVTNSAGSLPHLDSLDWQCQPSRSLSLLSGRGIKQLPRNAAVFALPEASRTNLRAPSTLDRHEYSTPIESSKSDYQLPSSNTLVSGTSGGYCPELSSIETGRSPPYQHQETLRILEGNGPYILDARDISRSQFQPGRGESEDTITLGRPIQLRSTVRRDMVDESSANEQVHAWTSRVFNQLGEEILSLCDMEHAATADREEQQLSPGHVEREILWLLDNEWASNRGQRDRSASRLWMLKLSPTSRVAIQKTVLRAR